jgi:hypothetical protein
VSCSTVQVTDSVDALLSFGPTHPVYVRLPSPAVQVLGFHPCTFAKGDEILSSPMIGFLCASLLVIAAMATCFGRRPFLGPSFPCRVGSRCPFIDFNSPRRVLWAMALAACPRFGAVLHGRRWIFPCLHVCR